MASSNSRRLSFWTGSPLSSRRRASTGIGITACLHRTTRSGPPSRRWRSGTSASGKRPRLAGMRATGTAREAAATRLIHIKSHAHMAPRALPGRSSWRGWGRSFRSSARSAAATSGSLTSSRSRGRSARSSRPCCFIQSGEPLEPPPLSPARGPPTDWGELVEADDDRAAVQVSPDEQPVIDIHSL